MTRIKFRLSLLSGFRLRMLSLRNARFSLLLRDLDLDVGTSQIADRERRQGQREWLFIGSYYPVNSR
ncbi:hypothetical protein RSAG8_11082, partial [Rhizoctonia solani AG-8 WAC10335]